MNYIKRLEEENRIMKEHIAELERYLRSSKFQGMENNFVNPQDIFLRLNEMKEDVSNVEFA